MMRTLLLLFFGKSLRLVTANTQHARIINLIYSDSGHLDFHVVVDVEDEKKEKEVDKS